MKMTQHTPIRVGDKFKVGETILEVIGTKPGGKVELFDRQRARFTDRWHREVKNWERIAATVSA
jgi:hypothetical protein